MYKQVLLFSMIFACLATFAIIYLLSIQKNHYNKVISFEIRGIAYNPVTIDSGKLDPLAPQSDLPKIAELGVNTISTYNLGEFDWESKWNLMEGSLFYDNLAPIAEKYNLNIIVGYFSNATTDWTNPKSIERVTKQYQNLVLKTKERKSTLIYLIGNEIFEKLSSVDQKIGYARWIGEMVKWTHLNDPKHPVTYADDAGQHGLKYLQTFAPEIDIYSLNNYEWNDSATLRRIISNISNKWPGKSLLIHEWGVDSWDNKIQSENEVFQAKQIDKLLVILNKIYDEKSFLVIGNIYFEFSDQWDKTAIPNKQDVGKTAPWLCHTCFDDFIDEDYLGITKGVSEGESETREIKSAYLTIKNHWDK